MAVIPNKKNKLVYFLVIPALFLGLYSLKAPSINVRDGYLEVSGMYSLRQPLSEVLSVSLETDEPKVGLKIFGTAVGNNLKGKFKLGELGSGNVYITRNNPPYIIMRTSDSTIIMNDKDPAKTRELYNQILADWKK